MTKLTYKRMWENKGHRPYWALLHIYGPTKPLHWMTGFGYKKPIYVIDKNGHNAAYLHVGEMEESTKYFRKWWKNEHNIKRYHAMLDVYFKEASEVENEYHELDWSTLSDKEILRRMKKLANFHEFTEFHGFPGFSYIFVTQPQHVIPLEEELHILVEGYANADKIIAHVTTPRLPLPFDEEQQELAKYRRIWDTLSADEKEKTLESLSKKFGWFGGVEGENDYDKEHYEKEILSEPVVRAENEILGVDPKVKQLGHTIGLLSNKRICCRYHGMYLRYFIKVGVQELTKRWNIKNLEYATLPEIEEYHNNRNIGHQVLEQRKNKGYVATLIGSKPVLLTGEGAKDFHELVKEAIGDTSEVKGRCACPGKVRGKVRIISFASGDYHKEVSAFENGEILVTGMTRPQIAHLCHKASAIITDEGGITSHASIISREFNIPCVIGTDNATKIFKTGDLIEIDAANGVARKID